MLSREAIACVTLVRTHQCRELRKQGRAAEELDVEPWFVSNSSDPARGDELDEFALQGRGMGEGEGQGGGGEGGGEGGVRAIEGEGGGGGGGLGEEFAGMSQSSDSLGPLPSDFSL